MFLTWSLPAQITRIICHLAVCWGKGHCVGGGGGHECFLSPQWPINTHYWFWLWDSLRFNKMLQCKRGQMRIKRCDWAWGGGGRREWDRQFTSDCDFGGGGRCMTPSQQSSGKQWSRLMIHSLIVMAPTERMGARHSSLEINSQELHEY